MGLPGPLNRGGWRKPEFRQKVREKIEKVLLHSPNATYRNAGKLEAYSYATSSTQQQYLASVAQLIIHFEKTEPRGAPARSLHHVRPMMALRTMINRAGGAPTVQRRGIDLAANVSGSSSPSLLMITYHSVDQGRLAGPSRVVVPRAMLQPEDEQAGGAGPQE